MLTLPARRPALFVMVLAALCVMTSGLGVAKTQYLSSVDDFPIAPELAVVPASETVFDKQDGRIITATATAPTSATADSIDAFYRAALPPLGWQAVGARQFVRQNERLLYTLRTSDKAMLVQFTFSPQTGE